MVVDDAVQFILPPSFVECDGGGRRIMEIECEYRLSVVIEWRDRMASCWINGLVRCIQQTYSDDRRRV